MTNENGNHGSGLCDGCKTTQNERANKEIVQGKWTNGADRKNRLTGTEVVKNPTILFNPFLVQVDVSILNCRKGPGINYPILGQVRRNETFTIVQESNGPGSSKWGKLKSGAGWLSLDHTKRK